MIPAAAITGVILCGGEGRRMGGAEKSLAMVGGMPLVGHVRARLSGQVGAVIISANRDLPAHAAWGDPLVSDREPGLGPLGGLISAMETVVTEWTFCCPGDAPLLAGTLVRQLAEAMESAQAEVAMPHDGERSQQLFLLLRSDLRHSLREYLARGGRSVLGWTETLKCAVVDASTEQASFLNVNTEEELQRASSLFHPRAD